MKPFESLALAAIAALALLIPANAADAQPATLQPKPSPSASWSDLKDKAWKKYCAQKDLEREAQPKAPEPLKWVTTACAIRACRPGVEKPTRDENGRYKSWDQRNMISLGKGRKVPAFAENDSTVTIQHIVQDEPVMARFPKEAFVEYGGQPSDEGIWAIESWDWFPEVRPSPTPTPAPEKRTYLAGEPPDDPQGRTSELLAALQKAVWHYEWSNYTRPEDIEAVSDLVGNPSDEARRLKSLIPVFPALGQALAAGADPQKPEHPSEFSLRPELEKWKVSVKGSPEAIAARRDISCVTRSYQAALELLWSQEESRPVKLSAAFLRWAHNQQGNALAKFDGASASAMATAIQQYGVCDERLMPESQRTPSPEALRDAAKRKNLVVRRVCVTLRDNPNQPEKEDRMHPIMPLVDHELRQGRPILVTGALVLPKNLSNPLTLTHQTPVDPQGDKYYASTYGADKGMVANARSVNSGHTRLLIGYKTIARARNDAFDFLLEHRESSGTNMGDKGHIYTLEPEDRSAEYWSLGLK